MTGPPDPDELLRELQDRAGDPPLTPLRLGVGPASARSGVAGAAVTRMRAAVLRLLSPVLGDLLAQLERDRYRQRAELERLQARVEQLERDSQSPQ